MLVLSILCSVLIGSTAARAEDRIWDVVTVIGSRESEANLPGSGDVITTDEIRAHSYDDVNRILRQIPGVYVREEDGYGLFPNISLRGVDAGRSHKVTIMEDGITAAPYSAPSAYYSPTTGRMSRVEVLKGSSQIKYGPHTTGGVINYVSTPIPEESEFYTKGLYGTDNESRVHSYFGDKVQTKWGKIGYILEEYYRDTDGFKTIDETPDFSKGDETGFTKTEPMFKMSWETNDDAARYQKVETKFGYTDLDANETYTGLSENDIRDNPYRRYAATRFDNIDSEEARSYLRYSAELSDYADITLTGYYNQFQRNWHKLHNISGGDQSTISKALATEGTGLSILKGEAAGILNVRNNSREYAQYGYLGNVLMDFETGVMSHNLEMGLGLHKDYVRRKQNTISYTQDANGTITSTSVSADGTAGNRRQDSDAISSYIRDSIGVGDWTLTPGFRFEKIHYEYVDYDTSGTDPDLVTGRDTSSIGVMAGGIGVNYRFDDGLSAFAGVHQGFSVPGPRDNAKSALKEETSLTKEIGVRFNQDAFQTELVYFHTDFNDLLVKDNIGGGGAGDSENVGDVIAQGIEWKSGYDLGAVRGWSFKNSYHVTFTYTNARLDGDSSSTDAESIFAGCKDGNKVPYTPEYQFALGTGLEFDQWGVFIDGTYVGETFSTADNADSPYDTSETPDARFGKTDEFFIVDISGYYNLRKDVKLISSLHNVGNLEYIVSRHPHGPRPGKPFTALVGLEMKF